MLVLAFVQIPKTVARRMDGAALQWNFVEIHHVVMDILQMADVAIPQNVAQLGGIAGRRLIIAVAAEAYVLD
jgi:hypothetical protein